MIHSQNFIFQIFLKPFHTVCKDRKPREVKKKRLGPFKTQNGLSQVFRMKRDNME